MPPPLRDSADFLDGSHDREQRALDGLQARHGGVDADLDAVPLKRGLAATTLGAPADQHSPVLRKAAQHHVVEHGEGRNQTEVLVHEAQAESPGGARAAEGNGAGRP